MQNFVVKQSGLVVVMSLLLTACGGGGGGSSSSANNISEPPRASTAPTPITVNSPVNNTGSTVSELTSTTPTISNNVPTSTDSPLTLLNNLRTTCGFSSLRNHAELAKASENHNKYMSYISETTAKAGLFISHHEITEKDWKNSGSLNPYFSGTSVLERVRTGSNRGKSAITVNYPFATNYILESNGLQYNVRGNGFVFENIAVQNDRKDASVLLRSLLATPYHLQSLVSQHVKDVGLHFHQSNEWRVPGYNPISASYLTLILGLQQGETPQFSNKTLSYPCANITEVEHTITHEYPDPFVNHSRGEISKAKPIGQPVYIISPQSKEIRNISNVSFKPTNGVVSPTVWVMFNNATPNTNKNHMQDVHGKLKNNEAFLIPDEALKPSTTYEVSYTIRYQDNSTENVKFRFATTARTID